MSRETLWHKEIIKSIISRCKKSSIRDTLVKWGRLDTETMELSFEGKKTKKQLADALCELIEEDLTDEVVGDLELVYMQLHSKSKTWTAFKLIGDDVATHLDPRTLRSRVCKNLQPKWKAGTVFGNMRLSAGAVWLRMHCGQDKERTKRGETPSSYKASNSAFVVTFTGSPFVIVNHLSSKLQTIVLEAVVEAMNAESIKDIKLSGRHISSLASIVLKKDLRCISNYQNDDQAEENMDTSRQDRKRKAEDDDVVTPDDLQDMDSEEREWKKTVVEKKFGTGPQPMLETLDYKFKVKFHGEPESEVDCKTSIVIKGQSTLDGLCQLAKKGLVRFPLPKHLTSVKSNARNSFNVQSAHRN